EAGAGLFLGVTMKWRLPHFTILLLGVTSAALTVSGLTILLTLLSGLPLTDIALQLRRSYQILVSVADFVAPYAGLAVCWRPRGARCSFGCARASTSSSWARTAAASRRSCATATAC